jgi:prevent-host-death family protein
MHIMMSISEETRSSLQVSIATARSTLPALVHLAEEGRAVEITRRGRPVAVLLSAHAYRRLVARNGDLFAGIQAFRKRHDLRRLRLDAALADLRDASPGRPEREPEG